ncbi:MAG: S41 family peptidase [Azospirillaceae bacterium]
MAPVSPARRPVAGVLAAALFALAALGACSVPDLRTGFGRDAGATPAGDSALPAGGATVAVFDMGFERIEDIYIDAVPIGDLAVTGLAALDTHDPAFGVDRTETTVSARLGGAELLRVSAPTARDARGWAAVAGHVVAAGQAASPALGDLEREAIYETVFDAALDGLDDYSRYVDPESAREERAQRDGYGGIGLLIEYDADSRAIVLQVFDEGPAAGAGIEPGWYIETVDGESIADWDIGDVGRALRGRSGTPVRVTFSTREGVLRSYTLTRARVVPNVVATRRVGDVIVAEVLRFNAATTEDLTRAIDETMAGMDGPPAGVVLDLRGNPGGLLGQAVAVADLFVDDGLLIETRGRHPDSAQRFDARRGDILAGLPLAVLIDGRSASGAEVVAAALQDSGRAVLVGSSTFGKGSVQTVTRLPNDGELFLTWSRIYAPSGYTLHRQGVMPTLCTSAGIDQADSLIDRFRSGRLAIPAQLTAAQRAAPESESALDALRSACPWRAHDAELDLEVARRVVSDPMLYAEVVQARREEAFALR